MAIHKLQIDDFLCTDYEVIAIHSSIEDYRLAFFLNKELKIHLHKNKSSIELRTKKGKSSFEHFIFDDERKDVCWHLISNKSELKTEENSLGFFENVASASYLIPEFKTADYILKIENVDPLFKIDEVINTIKKIPFIPLVYTIEEDQIKSKNNLIF